MPARGGFVTDPETGEPGVQRHAARRRRRRSSRSGTRTDATTMVGFDDDFDATVATVAAHAPGSPRGGPVEVGAIGVGDWQLRAGPTRRSTYALRGLRRRLRRGDPRPAGRARASRGGRRRRHRRGHGDACAGRDSRRRRWPASGMFGLIARPAPRPDDDVDRRRRRAPRQPPTSPSWWSASPRSRRPRRSTSPRCACPARRTSWSRRSPPRRGGPWSWSTRRPRCSCRGCDEVDAVLWAGPARPGGRPRGRRRAARRHRAGRPAGHHVPGRRRRGARLVGHPGRRRGWPTTRAPFIGYRGHYAGRAPEPAFWFGHGLGYATWEYGDAEPGRPAPHPTVAVDA